MGLAKFNSTSASAIAKYLGITSPAKIIGIEVSQGITSKLLMHFDQTYPYKDEISGATFDPTAIDQYASGKFGYAVVNNAVDALLYTDNETAVSNLSINMQQGFSVEAFVKFSGQSPGYILQLINEEHEISFLFAGGEESTDIMLYMVIDSFSMLVGDFFAGAVSDVDTWNHIVFQYDGDSFKIGVEGIIVYSTPVEPAIMIDFSSSNCTYIVIPIYGSTSNPHAIDELRVLDQPLFNGDVSDPYDVPTSPYSS